MKTRLIIYFVSFLILVFFYACKKSSSLPTSVASLIINSQTIVPDSVLAQYDSTSSGAPGLKQRRMKIYYFWGTDRFSIFINNWSWQQPPLNSMLTKTYSNCQGNGCTACLDTMGTKYCDGWDFAYSTQPYSYLNTYSNNSQFILTKCDVNALKINGSFNGTMYISSGNTDSLSFSGSVKDLSYSIH